MSCSRRERVIVSSRHPGAAKDLLALHRRARAGPSLRSGRRKAAQNGSFIPGGSGMPAVAAAIFSCEAALILLTASLNAAATRSSAISGSASAAGSMRTLRQSMRPPRVTLTMPPPALPVTSSAATSSCARCTFSCIFCACCISWAMFPRMSFFRRVDGWVAACSAVERPDRIGHDPRAVHVHHPADGRVVGEAALGLGLAVAALAVVARAGGLAARLAGFEAQLHVAAQQACHRVAQLQYQARRL